MTQPRSHPERRGFTLLELMIVVVILGILATIVVPRFVGGQHREFDLTVNRCADLLTMYAQRSAVGKRPVGIWYDEGEHRLYLAMLAPDPDDDDAPESWRPDRTVNGVAFPAWMLPPALRTDTEYVDIADRPFASEPGRPRRPLELSLASHEYDLEAVLTLAPHAIAPRRVSDDDSLEAVRMPVDLDALGRTQEDW